MRMLFTRAATRSVADQTLALGSVTKWLITHGTALVMLGYLNRLEVLTGRITRLQAWVGRGTVR